MMIHAKCIIIFLLFCVVLQPLNAFAVTDVIFNPHQLLSDEEFLDAAAMSKNEVHAFLQRGSLGTLVTENAHGVRMSAADIIWNASQQFLLNPKFLLVLLQREQSLVEDDVPTQDQLDWAMGYAVCDDCEKTDPRIQKFKGFGNQVHFAAQRIRENYLRDLEDRGFTESGVGPGIEHVIDGQTVIPVNFVTSALYTYTPHLEGNENFVKIWSRWFTHAYLSGSLLQDKTTGGVWLIEHDLRRPIQSRAALYSRFDEQRIIAVDPSQLDPYPIGVPIAFPNYSLLRSPKGTVFLIVDDVRRGFTSQESFRALGYSPDEILDVSWDDLNAFTEGDPLTTSVVYPQGAYLQNTATGGVFFVQNGYKHPIMSKQILEAQVMRSDIVSVAAEDLEAYETSDPLLFPEGSLVAVKGSPDIFVISDHQRHHVTDEQTFLSYGWNWNQVIWTNERSVLLHPLGSPLTIVNETSDSAELLTL